MVVDLALLLHSCGDWGRSLRAHRPYADVEQIAAVVILDHTTHDRSTPSTILDSGACGDHAVHHLIVDDDVE